MATGSNTRSDSTAKVSFKPFSAGDCITDKMASEITRRLSDVLSQQSQIGDAVVSTTPPDDRTKIWYLADSNGVPTGQSYRFNPGTGQWESTVESIPPIPCISTNTSNLMSKDSLGCWSVDREAIEQVAQSVSVGVSMDANNAITLGSDGGAYLPISSVCISIGTNLIDRDENDCIRVLPSTDAGNAIKSGSDNRAMVNLPKILTAPVTAKSGATAAGSVDLTSITTVPSWATHAIVGQPSGQVFLPITSGFISHQALGSGQDLILYGFMEGQS